MLLKQFISGSFQPPMRTCASHGTLQSLKGWRSEVSTILLHWPPSQQNADARNMLHCRSVLQIAYTRGIPTERAECGHCLFLEPRVQLDLAPCIRCSIPVAWLLYVSWNFSPSMSQHATHILRTNNPRGVVHLCALDHFLDIITIRHSPALNAAI